MEAGTQVWCSDTEGEEAWLFAEVTKRTDEELQLQLVDNPSKKFTRKLAASDGSGERKYEGVELANAKLSDEEKAEGRDDDLITLPHLHEPALLHTVSERFFAKKIYTWTGPVLIAVNPFQRFQIYTNEILESYRREGLLRSQGMGDAKSKLAPHIYAIADRSYRQMMSEKRQSQSILISGESGAGKTESTKIVMLYLTTLGAGSMKSADGTEGDRSIMDRVLQSNPVLEAFGNARTLRNDNSSRFGKFIELGFSRAGSLMGAKVQTYLLEKVRLAFHASGERNYHIFYQVVRGASEEQKKTFEFHDGVTQGLELPNYFHYTGQGGAPHPRGYSDESSFKYTLKAMASLGWSPELIDTVLALVAGLLHLGQLQFHAEEKDGVDASVVSDEAILGYAAKLLGVDTELLRTALLERVIVARGQEIRTNLTPEKSHDARDALAKTLYGSLFLWVVDQVNQSVGWKNDADIRSSVGVLDIFGFECFAVNSFEQLCINYTNEALQQQFNKFIFKMEQDEYEREKIQWAFISFPDNQDCLDTIQVRKTGILAMLDDECRLPRGSDRNYAKRMFDHYLPKKNQVLSDNTRFSATHVQKSKSIFCVRHFAGLVQYSAETGFMEKNKDEIPLTAKKLFETAPSQLVRDAFFVQKREIEETVPKGKSQKGPAKSKTVGQQFKEQLSSLIENVEKTDPHYIRCLKPNDAAKPMMLTKKRLTEQLRYGGVLEAVRVARMGYPVRLGHDTFYMRYRMILPTASEDKLPWSMEGQDPQKLCVKLVDAALEEGSKKKASAGGDKPDPNEEGISRAEKIRRMIHQPIPLDFPKSDVQLGLNKVFMRKPPHDVLESHRVFQQHASATIIQCWMRGLAERRQYLFLLDGAMMVQRFYRGCKGRERWWTLRRAVGAQLLSNNLRMQLVRRRFNRVRRGTIRLQGTYRGHALRRVLATIKVQKMSRMVKRRFIYKRLKSAVLSLQCAHRSRTAIAMYNELRKEQKDIGKLKENNEKLKLEMASLKAMLAAQAQAGASSAEFDKQLQFKEEEIKKLEKRISELENEIEKEKAVVKMMEDKMKSQEEKYKDEKTLMEKLHKDELKRAQQQRRSSAVAPASPQATRPSPRKNEIEIQAKVQAPVIQVQAPPPVQVQAPPQRMEESLMIPSMPANYVSPEIVAEHKAHVAQLEEELEAERKLRREADGEIIKLRATISGVNLQESEVEELLAQQLESAPPSKAEHPDTIQEEAEEEDEEVAAEERHVSMNGSQQPAPLDAAAGGEGAAQEAKPMTPVSKQEETKRREQEELEKIKQEAVTPAVVSALSKLGINEAKDNRIFVDESSSVAEEKKQETSRRNFLLKSPSEYLPMIRRGFVRGHEEKDEEQVISVGWKVEVRNRKEREEMLRDEVDRFEIKMKRFNSVLEEGIDVAMWQLSRKVELGGQEKDEFGLKSTAVTVKMHRRGDLYVQAVLTFSLRGGYLSKAMGRHRADKAALEPLSLYDILEVKAGCSGYDHTELPTASGKVKTGKKGKSDNRQASLFITIKATPTPEASFRSYILKFKSRGARNDVLHGLRSILADMQIHEGVSISSIQQGSADDDVPDDDEIMVPLSEVHNAINREREAYDRLLLLLLQGQEDLKEKEDEMLGLRGKLESVMNESAEKDRVQANDSKLIMQLSKKLETLLMDNEDLRDQNDRLNSRLVSVECEKMNLMSG